MRKPRQLKEGARYHVSARANRRELILDTAVMKELFLSVMKRAKAKYSFRIDNFCIMGNHFHLVIQPSRDESLSAIMQWILSVFAMAYNRILGITGHVWGCRFFSRILACLRDFIQAFDYIDNNPVKARQISHLREWPWGGLWHNRIGRRDLVEPPAVWIVPFIRNQKQLLLSWYTLGPRSRVIVRITYYYGLSVKTHEQMIGVVIFPSGRGLREGVFATSYLKYAFSSFLRSCPPHRLQISRSFRSAHFTQVDISLQNY